MLRRTIIVVCVVLYLLSFAVISHAQLPQISSGLDYLTSSQNQDGAWNTTTTTTQVETTAATMTVLDSMKTINQTSGTSYVAGISWLQAQSPQSVDYIAGQIRVLNLTGDSVNPLIPAFDASKGGTGGDVDYDLNPLDTASALQALKSANYSDLSVVNTALAYLTNTQNTDGGWGFNQNDDSSIFATAIVSATLQQFPQTMPIVTALNKATVYLISHQNADGGYGASPTGAPSSTAYETALAYVALIQGGQTQGMPLQGAITWLTSTQSINGSWSDDPYSTALALKALYFSEHPPGPPPPAPTTGAIMGTVVDATTGAPLNGVAIALTGNPSLSASTNSTGAFTLNNIPQGSQQLTISLAGYAQLVLTTRITAGTFINIGKVILSTKPTTGTVMGTVWDADVNAPYPGVTIEVNSGGNIYQAISGPDGSYKITGVNPGPLTVGIPSGPKSGYWNPIISGTLAPGGIMIYSPAVSTIPNFMSLSLRTDKAVYSKGDTVNLLCTLSNTRARDHVGGVTIKVTDPSGGIFYSSPMMDVSVAGESTNTFKTSFSLSADAQGGFYTIQAENYDYSTGRKMASSSTSFGIFKSSIAVTPALPAAFSTGVNTVSYNLVNTGSYAVTSGVLSMSLKDPDGQIISTDSQTFTLAPGENKSLVFTVSIPPLKYGTYTLSYTQSDETTKGQAKDISLPNAISIALLFDKTSYRIRETANLLVTLTNTGKFNLDTATLNVSVPDITFTDKKTLSLAPGQSQPMTYALPLPEALTAGLHSATIMLTLPSGAALSQSAQFSVPDSSLSLSLPQTAYKAGDTISPVVTNSGGEDTQVQCKLSLYDARSALIVEKTDTGTIAAGSSLPLGLIIPSGAADGPYNLVANYQDSKTGKAAIIPNPITITGAKGSLQVQTDKQTYLATESINALSSVVANNGASAIQNGKLHLQVTTETGNLKQKTWTSQYDFQQGVRSGVDTYGINDWIIPDDDFSDATVNTDRWQVADTTCIRSGTVLVDVASTCSSVIGKLLFEGDFDIQVDFTSNNSYGAQGAQFSINNPSFDFFINNTIGFGFYAQTKVGNSIVGRNYYGSYAPSGKFRITRTGTTIVGYAWIGSSWFELLRRTNTQFAENCYAALEVWREPGQPASATFDNFKVNSGRIKTENQTVNSVRLLPLSDNFDAGILNEDRWSISKTDNSNITEQNGKLYMEGTASNQNVGANAIHKAAISGDATAQVDYGLDIWASQNTEKVGLSFVSSPAYYIIERMYDTVWGTGNNYASHFYGAPVLTVPTSDTGGVLRIARTSGSISASYLAADDWKTQQQQSNVNGTGFFRLALWNDTGFPNPVTKILFDNFKITGAGKYATHGTLTERYDAGQSTKWGAVTWTSSEPTGTSIKFRTRTAADAAGLNAATWSDYVTASGSTITSSPGRWIEVEASLETTDTNITPVLHDVTLTYGNNPGDILWQTDVPVSGAQGATSNLSNSIGALGVTGKLYLQGELTSATGQSLASAEYPFYVEQGNIQLLIASDKKIYKPGETVTISGEARNLSSIDATGLSLLVKSSGTGSGTLYTENFDLTANGAHPFSFTTVAGVDGTYGLNATVSQNSTTLTQISDLYITSSPALTATLTAPDTAGADPFTVILSLNNSGKVSATTTMKFTDNKGQAIDNQTITIPAGETRMLQYTRQITEDTTYSAVFSGDLTSTATKTVAYTTSAGAISVSSKIVTDKVSYTANNQVMLTSTVTANVIQENLSALVTIANSQGYVLFSATATIPTIVPGQLPTITKYWNTATNAAGIYRVTLQILNAAGAVISTSTGNLTIANTTKPTALLKGQISLDKQSILTGDPVTVSYSVTNVGNMDLASIALSVRTVNMSEQTVYNTITAQTALAMGAIYTNSGRIDTQSYSAKDYLVVLSASINSVEETLAGTYFRVEGAPSAPALISPANGADVDTFTPALTVSNASDPNDDKLTYEFEIYSDNGLTSLVNSSGAVAETAGSTVWLVSAPLTENQTYFWRARAYDGKLYGPWMETATLRVNTANDPPTAPIISSPAGNGVVSSLTPALTVLNATDPDSPSLTYNFDLALDSGFNQIVSTISGVAEGTGATSWQVPVSLTENTTYYWRSRADDWIVEGPWSTTGRFFVSTVNDPPSAPVIVTPANGAILKALEADIAIQNSTDPDSPGITYAFELDTVPTFDSANIVRSSVIQQGLNSTTWHVTGLAEDTQYYARAKASDGQAESAWSGVAAFFVSATNSAPTAPTLANPSNGGGVNVFTPTLSINNSTDPDRDTLTYEFEVYGDESLSSLVTSTVPIAETSGTTSWVVPVSLTENKTYYWRARAFDGELRSPWMVIASFMINTANDAPGAPMLLSPADGGAAATLTPTLVIANAKDPDNDKLTYEYEVYQGSTLIAVVKNVLENGSGETSATLTANLADNTVYQWRARAFDGERYGPWTTMASFTVHTCQHKLKVDIDFEPKTLNKNDCGKWVLVRIELPHGYKARDVDISSILLENTVHAEPWPFECHLHHHDHGCDHDRHGHHHEVLIVKFRRSEVIKVLPEGKRVPVHVTGMVKSTPVEGVDIIRVTSSGHCCGGH